MEAAVRAFEDWEFRVLELESGIDEKDESAAEEQRGGCETDLEKEISCHQHVVNAAQVNMSGKEFSQEFHSCPTRYTGLKLSCLLCASCHRLS